MSNSGNKPIDFGRPDWSLQDLSTALESNTGDLYKSVSEKLEALIAAPTNPQALNDYQAALSSYTTYRNMHSNTIKAMKDLDAALINNFR